MALDSPKAHIEDCEIRDRDDARGGASTKTPYGERLLHSDEIRLLTIENDMGALRLRITVHKFQDDLELNAISYVWGAAEASINVACNGTELAVTPIVFEMLQSLDPSASYWLDSICVNQQDAEEKAIQVPLMHRIYSRAATVVIWMGIPTMQIEKFVAEFPRWMEKEREWNSVADQGHRPSIDLLITDKDILQGISHVLNNEWFDRLWTFQECVLAERTIMLHGHLWIDFDEFLIYVHDGFYLLFPYLTNCLHNADMLDPSIRSSAAFRTLKIYREGFGLNGMITHDEMPYLLYTLRTRNVKEPVDRAWAITGLFSKALRMKLDPLVDYTDNGRSDFWKTHILFAKTIMVEEQTLGLLMIPPTIGERPHSVPSWCPALEGTSKCGMIIAGAWTEKISGQDNALLLEEVVDEADQVHSTNPLKQPSHLYKSRKFISFETGSNHLKVCGHTVDTISEVVDCLQLQGRDDYTRNIDISTRKISNPIHAANVDHYNRGLHLARRTVQRTNEDTTHVPPEYLMSLVLDTRLCRDATTAYEDAWAAFTDQERHKDDLSGARLSRADILYGILISLTGHSFFSTTGGRFGIATPGCKPGDKICVFYDERPLHILRWSEPENETGAIHGDGPAEFCGVAFIPHLMKPHEQEAARLGPDETFVIR